MQPAPSIAAAILAGGKARRLGGADKSRLLVEGRSIITRQVDVLQQVAGELFVVAPDAARFADLNLPVHADLISGQGVLGAVYTALEVAHADLVLTVACDLPFLSAPLLCHLANLAVAGDGAWVHTARGAEPLLACYRRTARSIIRAQIEHGRLKAADLGLVLRILEVDREAVERFGPAERLLANINTFEEYRRWNT